MPYNPNSGVPPTVEEIRACIEQEYLFDYRAIENTKFASTTDRLIALKGAKDSRDLASDILMMEESDKGISSVQPDVKEAHEICWQFVRTMLWNAFNGIRNMVLRAGYITKIRARANEILEQIKGFEENKDYNSIRQLSERVSSERNSALEITRARLSRSSASFSKMLKEDGITYNSLLDKYSIRKYGKAFEKLNLEEQSQIHIDIIKASGRSNKIVNIVSRISGNLGIILFVFMLSTTVWDIVESANPLEESIKDVWIIIASGGAGMAGDTMGALMATNIAALLGASDAVAASMGWIGGITVGFVLVITAALAAEALFELIASAFRLHIPPELMKSTFHPIYVPLDSPLYARLSA